MRVYNIGMKRKKVALGLSGGVDSAVSAWLLREQGYEVIGVFMECYHEDGCRSDEDRQDALKVAMQLQIPFQSLDFRSEYKQKVLDYFYTSYQAGKTPNPDMACNREIKFGLFYQWAMKNGFDYLATGHYARVELKAEEKKVLLYTPVDKKKDQTYFLALVAEDKWSKVLFPLGEKTKKQVRAMAHELKLGVANKKESMGVCFVGDLPMRDLLSGQIKPKKGLIVREINGERQVIGEHEGVEFYTIGQRHGLKIKPQEVDTPIYYVKKKEKENNILLVGEKEELKQEWVLLKMIKTEALINLAEKSYYLRIRHQGELIKITKIEKEGEKWQIALEKKVFGASEGQFGVIYEKDKKMSDDYWVVGVGEIEFGEK